ncbi:unnamed protein product [Leuciscus chuanchicus]
MAVRGCVTLLFFLLSGIVLADDLMTSPLPAAAESSTSKLSVMSTTAPPTTSEHLVTTHAGVTSTSTQQTTNATTTAPPTTTHKTTNATTAPPTTTQHTTTNATTAPPTTTQHTTTNATTAPPTTTQHTTTNGTTEPPTTMHHNTTNSTTQAPTTTHTNATTAPTPPPTTPPVPNPAVGNYSVKSDNVSACLLAKMGLQFSFSFKNGSVQTLNLDPSPNVTEASGTCGIGGSDSSLVLKSKEMTVQFVFTNVSQKFRLHALTFLVDLGNGSFINESNYNLSLWEASFGSSYMCRKEQSYNISGNLTVNTFELQVQPFAVQKNMFGTAEDCEADEPDNFIIPIAVGVALAVLVVIVLLAYLIGRKRSQTSGYEQFDS